MRHCPTDSEWLLWQHLKAKQLGVAFRRQVPLCGNYIVDFYASSVRLVVEIDGVYHAGRVRLDAKREARLCKAGYHVLRLTDELVRTQPLVAVECVRRVVCSR
jgi:very-short-patch-repair endonuclease